MIDPVWIDRAVGALAGTFIAMVFILPKSWRDMWRRLAVGCVTGLLGARPVREWLIGWPDVLEYRIAGGFLAAFAGWAALGAVLEIVQRKGKK